MAIVTNAFSTYTAIGIREDLADVIYDISPTETPFQSNIARTSVSQKMPEWQTDSLATAATNRQLEGDTIAGAAVTATTRLRNYTQISYKAVAVTGTTESSDAAGRAGEMSYQIAKRGKELKRDMEKALTGNQGSVAQTGTGSARSLAGCESWITTNKTQGSGGTSPGYQSTGLVTAPTDATTTQLQTLTEALLKSVIADVWSAGGDATMIMCGPTSKQDISGFSGIGTLYQDVTRANPQSPATIIGAADLYISDFGRHTVVPNRFSRDRTVLVLDPSMWAVGFLRPMQVLDLAKTGDSDLKAVLAEYTLISRNEAASGKIADVS